MKERRQERRIGLQNSMRYGTTEPPRLTSLVTDISENGVHMETNRVFPPGTMLFLVIETEEGALKAEGTVVWTKKAPPHLIRRFKGGMGIRFTRVDPGIIELCRQGS